MADEKFFEREISMKEVFLFFLHSGRKVILHDGKLLCFKKSGKKQYEISSQWLNFRGTTVSRWFRDNKALYC